MSDNSNRAARVSRRCFLRQAATLGVGLTVIPGLLAACAPDQPTATPVEPTRQPAPGATLAGEPQGPSAVPTPTTLAAAAGGAYLAVARGGEPEELVRRALAAVGGMQRFVQRGNDVILKPNICTSANTYEYAAATNPLVVAELVRLCRESGARRVRVMDSPFGGTADEAYQRSGIRQAVEEAGGQMEIMSSFKFVTTALPLGVDLRELMLYDDILKADVVINVPIAKHHSLARLTLGMKNLMGTMNGRSVIHRNIGQRLADLNSRVRPALTVIDAVRILRANGPTGGSLDDVDKLDTVIVSPDVVAADAYAAGLFGVSPDTLNYVVAGVKMGLGRSDLSNLDIEEIQLG